jgi:sec-independent protein translocase protein TatC
MTNIPPPEIWDSSTHSTDSIFGHLRELRSRLMVSIVAWMVGSTVCYYFIDRILAFLTAPLADAFPDPSSRRLIFTSLPEAFVTYLKLAMFAGFMLAFPVLALQLYRFIAPGLYKRERRAVFPFIAAAPVLFYAGAALAYYYVFPLAWQFFVGFELPAANSGDGLSIQLETKLSEYLSLVCSMIMAFGIAFQMPLALVLLIRGGVLSSAQLSKGRRYAVVLLLTAAAILTPPDIFSQIGLFIPLYGLYELAIIAGRWVEKNAVTRT